MPLLDIQNLSVAFHTPAGVLHAVDDLSFSVDKGETLCIVGESGCGKSVTAQSILRLVPVPPGEITGGRILFEGRDILAMPPRQLTALRGNEIAMIFQDPMTSLNPVFTCGFQLMEAIRLHQGLDKKAARASAIDILRQVRIPDPHKRVDEYPHQLSGGMRQRVMIAIALSCRPKLLIADEPTTALDVTIQAQILALLADLKSELGMALIFITHDLGIVQEIADNVLVLYAGKAAERGPAAEIYGNPRHPYTIGLLNSVPRVSGDKKRLEVIAGALPNPMAYPQGCRFYERCARRTDECLRQPSEFNVTPGHTVACWNWDAPVNIIFPV